MLPVWGVRFTKNYSSKSQVSIHALHVGSTWTKNEGLDGFVFQFTLPVWEHLRAIVLDIKQAF